MSKQIFFCFSAASGTLRENPRIFYCGWRRKFFTEALLSNTRYFCMVDSDVQLNNTQRMRCSIANATVVTRKGHNVTVHVSANLVCAEFTMLLLLFLSPPWEPSTLAVRAFYWQWGKNRNTPWVIRCSENIKKLIDFLWVQMKYKTYLIIENSITNKAIVVTDSTRTIRIKQWKVNSYYSHLQNRSHHSCTHHGESFSAVMDSLLTVTALRWIGLL